MNKPFVLAIVTLVSLTRLAAAEETPVQDDKTAAAVKAALAEDRKAREGEKLAEARYQNEAITFTDLYTSNNGVVTEHTLIPYRGGRKLTTEEFYEAVDRADLAATYKRRTRYSYIAFGSALALGAGALYLMSRNLGGCDASDPDYRACQDKVEVRQKRDSKFAFGMTAGSIVASGVAFAFRKYRNGASQKEAHDMVDNHNAKLRQKHGLPTARLRPRLQEVAVAPYAEPDGGGLAISGRF